MANISVPRPTAVAVGVGIACVAAAIAYRWFSHEEPKATRSFRKALQIADANRKSLHTDLLAVMDQVRKATSRALVTDMVSAQDPSVSGLTGRGASGYYHFSSSGTKLPSKWDKFDVDAELAKLDANGDDGPLGGKSAGATARPMAESTASTGGPTPSMGPSRAEQLKEIEALLRDLGAVERGCEVTLSDLDGVPAPDDGCRVQRKAVVARVQALLTDIDRQREAIRAWKAAGGAA